MLSKRRKLDLLADPSPISPIPNASPASVRKAFQVPRRIRTQVDNSENEEEWRKNWKESSKQVTKSWRSNVRAIIKVQNTTFIGENRLEVNYVFIPVTMYTVKAYIKFGVHQTVDKIGKVLYAITCKKNKSLAKTVERMLGTLSKAAIATFWMLPQNACFWLFRATICLFHRNIFVQHISTIKENILLQSILQLKAKLDC